MKKFYLSLTLSLSLSLPLPASLFLIHSYSVISIFKIHTFIFSFKYSISINGQSTALLTRHTNLIFPSIFTASPMKGKVCRRNSRDTLEPSPLFTLQAHSRIEREDDDPSPSPSKYSRNSSEQRILRQNFGLSLCSSPCT